MKILLSVGCSNFKFDRLFKIIDELCEEKILDGSEIIAQTGVIDYKIKHYENFSFASNETMSKYQEEADLIICHAGTGTVIGSLKKGKKIIVFPRQKQYNEHESDHQFDLANQFYNEGYVLLATNKQELKSAIDKIDSFTPKIFVSNKENFVEMIRNLL